MPYFQGLTEEAEPTSLRLESGLDLRGSTRLPYLHRCQDNTPGLGSCGMTPGAGRSVLNRPRHGMEPSQDAQSCLNKQCPYTTEVLRVGSNRLLTDRVSLAFCMRCFIIGACPTHEETGSPSRPAFFGWPGPSPRASTYSQMPLGESLTSSDLGDILSDLKTFKC